MNYKRNYTVQMLIDDLMEFNPNAKIINTVEIGWNTNNSCDGKKEAEYIAINYNSGDNE